MKMVFTALFAFTVMTIANAQAAEASCGTFEVAKGTVSVESGGKSTPAKVGSKICSGDTVVAAADSRAKIKMEDGNELNISPDSKIVLENYQYSPVDNKKKVLLNILKGKVRATTREENMYTDKAKDGQANTFQVKTKSAVAGVRGTDFLTGFDPAKNTMSVVTFTGKVEVASVGSAGTAVPVMVAAGQKTEVKTGVAPQPPVPVPPAELQKSNKESTADGSGKTVQSAPAASTNDKGAAKEDSSAEKKDAASSDKKEAAADKKEAAGDKKEAASDKKEAATDKKEAAPEKKEAAAADKKEPVAEKKEAAATEKKEVVTEKKEPVAADKKEVATDKKSTTAAGPSSGTAANSNGSGASGDRQPAAAETRCSMCGVSVAADAITAPSSSGPGAIGLPSITAPPMAAMPVLPPMPVNLPTVDTSIIERAKAKVNVQIRFPGQ